MSALNRTDFKALAMLRYGALVRVGGQWRFGTTWIGDSIVDRLKSTGRVSHLFPGQGCECIILRVP